MCRWREGKIKLCARIARTTDRETPLVSALRGKNQIARPIHQTIYIIIAIPIAHSIGGLLTCFNCNDGCSCYRLSASILNLPVNKRSLAQGNVPAGISADIEVFHSGTFVIRVAYVERVNAIRNIAYAVITLRIREVHPVADEFTGAVVGKVEHGPADGCARSLLGHLA